MVRHGGDNGLGVAVAVLVRRARGRPVTAMQALWRARAAWERTQPQLFLEVGPLEEAPAPQLTGVRGRAAGVSSSGPLLLATTSPPPRGRSTSPPRKSGEPLPARRESGSRPRLGALHPAVDSAGERNLGSTPSAEDLPTTAARPQPLGERCAAGPQKERNP